MKICKREDRPRPTLTTPTKGSPGDCTDETMAGMCDINRIIQRYGGNLAELAAWRGSMSFGDQPPDNLEDALEILNHAKDICKSHGVDSIAEAITKLSTPEPVPAPVTPVVNKEVINKEVINHEASEN